MQARKGGPLETRWAPLKTKRNSCQVHAEPGSASCYDLATGTMYPRSCREGETPDLQKCRASFGKLHWVLLEGLFGGVFRGEATNPDDPLSGP